jgi:hypothetical protein
MSDWQKKKKREEVSIPRMMNFEDCVARMGQMRRI